MDSSVIQTIMNSYRRPIHSHGNITIPKDWRDEQDLANGDELIMHETDEGTLELIPPSEIDQHPPRKPHQQD